MKSIIELHGAFGDDAEKMKAEKPEVEVDNESQYIDAFGTMVIKHDDATTFYGRSSGIELSYLLLQVARILKNVYIFTVC
jgi:hypothetical protein